MYIFTVLTAHQYYESQKYELMAQSLGDLKMWGYFAFTVKPGKYAIEVDWPWDTTIRDYKLEFAVVAGETYYLRVSSKMGRIYYIGGPIVEFEGSASTTNKVKALAELRCGTNSCKITQ